MTVGAGPVQVLLPVAADPGVALNVAFQVGSQDDPPGKEGLVHLTATLMAEGATQRHAYGEVLELLYPMAASYEVRVDTELVSFSGRAHRDTLAPYVELFLDAVLRPAFDADDLERLRSRTVDALRTTLRYSSDEELGKAVLHTTVFSGTPYGHPPLGTVAGLESITLDDVRACYRRHFTRQRAILGVGGGFDAAVVERLAKALGRLSEGEPVAPPAVQPTVRAGRRVVLVRKPGPATAISFGFPLGVGRGDDDFYALWLANSWLGEHRNSASHLYQVIRDTRGLNYGDYSYVEWFPEAGVRQVPPPNVPRRRQLFEVWVRPVPNDTAHFALRAAVRELEALWRRGLDREQLELTRRFLAGYRLHYAETTAARLGYAIDDVVYRVPPPGHLERLAAAVESLTLDQVNAAIRRHLDPTDMVIVAVSGAADGLAADLAADVPSPITYAAPKPAAVLAEDRVIAAHRLAIRSGSVAVRPVDELFER